MQSLLLFSAVVFVIIVQSLLPFSAVAFVIADSQLFVYVIAVLDTATSYKAKSHFVYKTEFGNIIVKLVPFPGDELHCIVPFKRS